MEPSGVSSVEIYGHHRDLARAYEFHDRVCPFFIGSVSASFVFGGYLSGREYSHAASVFEGFFGGFQSRVAAAQLLVVRKRVDGQKAVPEIGYEGENEIGQNLELRSHGGNSILEHDAVPSPERVVGHNDKGALLGDILHFLRQDVGGDADSLHRLLGEFPAVKCSELRVEPVDAVQSHQ